jgi:hypothetical protein
MNYGTGQSSGRINLLFTAHRSPDVPTRKHLSK